MATTKRNKTKMKQKKELQNIIKRAEELVKKLDERHVQIQTRLKTISSN